MVFWYNQPPTRPHDIYARSFQPHGFGYPLLFPEPDPDVGEVQIGDVGFTHEGAFIRLFNFDTSVPANRVQTRRELQDIEPFPLDNDVVTVKRTPNKIFPCTLRTHGVEESNVHLSVDMTSGSGISVALQARFICREAYGAALTLQSAAHAKEVIPNSRLRSYILKSVDRYYEYATQELGHVIKRRDIIFVTGWTKTTPNWAATVLSFHGSSSSSGSLEARAAGVAGTGMSGSKARSTTTSPFPRWGTQYTPDSEPISSENAEGDQCLFMKRLKVRRRLFTKIVAGAGYHRLPHLDDGHGASGEEGAAAEDINGEAVGLWIDSGDEGTAPDHLDILLAYILQFPGVLVAIASDEEVESLLAGQQVIDFASWLRQSRLPVEISDDGVGSLDVQELVFHQQERRFAHPLITPADRDEWPHITRKDAGTLTDSQIGLGQTEQKACRMKYKAVVFGDRTRMRIEYSSCISLSADGKLLAAANGNTITVWRLLDALVVQRLTRNGHTKEINQVAFSPDGQHIVSGAKDKLALVWNVQTGSVVRRLEAHEDAVNYVTFSRDGTQVVTRSKNSLRMWVASSGDLLHAVTDIKSEDSSEILLSPDSSHIAARLDASPSNTAVAVLDCRTGERIATLRKQGILCMAFSPDGDRIATGSEDGSACVWDAASGEALLELKEHTGSLREVAFSQDGSEVTTMSSNGTLVMCDSHTAAVKHRFTFRPVKSVNAVSYSPTNNFIACGAGDGGVHVWDRKTGAFVASFQGLTNWVEYVMFTPDGWDVLSYGDDRVVRLWSIRDALRLS
ncbi:WD40 repeat domain-containing protein [Phanerochaete sordida]|uniref:WD40 repeat domain-containing protein n=1 Tax=Phanerochaete sordida TaxID=48140 RepID=A0A9P3G9K8_9APHY|nr:WD40 repeat domain-containing protein [Phanerochaete sordida]